MAMLRKQNLIALHVWHYRLNILRLAKRENQLTNKRSLRDTTRLKLQLLSLFTLVYPIEFGLVTT